MHYSHKFSAPKIAITSVSLLLRSLLFQSLWTWQIARLLKIAPTCGSSYKIEIGLHFSGYAHKTDLRITQVDLRDQKNCSRSLQDEDYAKDIGFRSFMPDAARLRYLERKRNASHSDILKLKSMQRFARKSE